MLNLESFLRALSRAPFGVSATSVHLAMEKRWTTPECVCLVMFVWSSMLMWIWPWPADLDIWTWPRHLRSSEYLDEVYRSKLKVKVKVTEQKIVAAVWFLWTKTKTKMVKNEKITNSLTKTKTKTKKWWKLKRKIENDWKRKRKNWKRKRKCQNSKTCHSAKVLAYNMALTGAMAVRRWIRD